MPVALLERTQAWVIVINQLVKVVCGIKRWKNVARDVGERTIRTWKFGHGRARQSEPGPGCLRRADEEGKQRDRRVELQHRLLQGRLSSSDCEEATVGEIPLL